jgi:hypothetical protein
METIGEYKVHPAASQFPLMEGNAFDEISSSIEEFGLIHPIVLKGDLLIDGRNRLRAATKLNTQYKEENRSHRIKITTVELPADINNVAEYIYDINISRRHLTTDQQSAIGAAIMPMIAQERESKQVASRFKAGNKAGPDGRKGKEPVNPKTGSPVPNSNEQAETVSPPPAPRDIKNMKEQSTIGQVAKLAKVSHYKAGQAVAVIKAVEAGELPKDTMSKVIAGEIKLKDALPKPIPKPAPATTPKDEETSSDQRLAFYHITQKIDQYVQKYPPMQSLKTQINDYFKSRKGDE